MGGKLPMLALQRGLPERSHHFNGAMEERLRRFESPVVSQTAKQGEHKSATKHGNSSGAMERYVTVYFETGAHAHLILRNGTKSTRQLLQRGVVVGP